MVFYGTKGTHWSWYFTVQKGLTGHGILRYKKGSPVMVFYGTKGPHWSWYFTVQKGLTGHGILCNSVNFVDYQL